jgi:6-phosphogluconolactonase (cycloisomerase 2 family)
MSMLSACGGGGGDSPRTYAIGANVSGLVGSRLALSSNGVAVSVAPGLNGRMPRLFADLPNGASYDVTVATQPTTPSQSCVVTNGKGTIAGADVDISVTCTTTPARFLLTQNKLGAAKLCIQASTLDGASGTVTASGSPLCDAVQGPGWLGYPWGSMAADPQGKFLYIGIPLSRIGCLCGFNIDRGNGAMTSVQLLTVYHMHDVAMHPSGQFLFATSGDVGPGGDVATYTVDSTSGALKYSSEFRFEVEPFDVNVDPLGKFVYVSYADYTDPSSSKLLIAALAVDPTTGALSQRAQPVAVSAGYGVTTHPSGRLLYVSTATYTSSNIAAFNVDPATGALTAISSSPVVASDGLAVIDPAGNYMYVVSYGSNSISAYGIDRSSGQLAPINGSPFPTGPHPSSVVIEPQGNFVYVSNDLGVSAYEIDSANGALTPVSGSPFPLAFGGRIDFSY